MGAACYAFVREPPPESLSLYVSPLGAHHSSHMSMVFMRWWPLGPATSMPIMWLFFPSYTWIDIVHNSEGSLSMVHGFCLWNHIIRFHRYWIFIIIVFTFMAFKHNDFKISLILDKLLFTLFIQFFIYEKNITSCYTMVFLKIFDMSTHWDVKSHCFRYFPLFRY